MIDRYKNKNIEKIWSDKNKYNLWLDFEMKYLSVITNKKINTKKLKDSDIKEIKKLENNIKHDFVSFIKFMETKLIKENVEFFNKFHIGLTSSNVIDFCFYKQNIDSLTYTNEKLIFFINTLKKKIPDFNKIGVGRTHGIHAEPYNYSLKLLNYIQDLRYVQNKIKDILSKPIPFSLSGSLGNYANSNINDLEKFIATYKKDGINIKPILTTQVINRIYYSEFQIVISQISCLLENIAIEIRNLQRSEIDELNEGFSKFQIGSSSMPHKKNPVKCESMCGLSRLIRNNVLIAFENIPLYHERDISHSSNERIIYSQSYHIINYMLESMSNIFNSIELNEKNMKNNIKISNGRIFSQAIKLEIIKNGLNKNVADSFIQELCEESIKRGKDFLDLFSLSSFKKYTSEEFLKSLKTTKYYNKNTKKLMKKFH